MELRKGLRRLIASFAILAFVVFGLVPLSAAPRAQLLWITTGGAAGKLDWTIDVCVAPDGKVWVADISDRFFIFDPKGELLGIWGRYGHGPGEFSFYQPRTDLKQLELCADVLFLPDGTFLVADYLNRRIQQFDHERNFLGIWDTTVVTPLMMALTPGGEVLVDDGARIIRFDQAGHRLGILVSVESLRDADTPAQGLAFNGFGVDPEGRIFATISHKARIFVFDSGGTLLGRFGEADWKAFGGLKPSWEKVFDEYGTTYVADSGNNRVVVFDRTGRFLFDFGRYGHGEEEFIWLTSIALDGQGNLYAADEVGKNLKKYVLSGLPSAVAVAGRKPPLE
jgi:DNA-binding beta-propeller fold protein YncE